MGFYENEKGNNKAEIYFDLATEQIGASRNEFIKYYLYNRLSKKFIDDDYEKSKTYLEKELVNIDLKNDDRGHTLAWLSLCKYTGKRW
ncbi:hypothetical protein [Romboutsia lituseburensis]|uniref:hypothetical protein n=1 Tax=Romboutsia lituseburensis TaxID=1537 RepID=UPI00215B587D|nr:hypothetical protein [Romboutsia lituseburensis]MCR8746021.1 hypothetical protein [Romboutsia lituseburensis]